jgi:catechol 2,3-dioxygenase-like lactoylglutathione lyase family enzyme
MRVHGILETCVYATDLAAAERFYADVLGLQPFARVARRHVFFRCGGGVFLVFNPEATSAVGAVPAHGAHGPGHVAFAVPEDELEAWRARFAANDVDVEAEVHWPRGGRSLYVRDPAGNSVELATPTIWGLPEQTAHAHSHDRSQDAG